MKIYNSKHTTQAIAKEHADKIEQRGGFSKTNYINEDGGYWNVRYWFKDKIEDGDKVRLKEETFSDNKPSFFIKHKGKTGVVKSRKYYAKHPLASVYTLTVEFTDGEIISTNDYHFELK